MICKNKRGAGFVWLCLFLHIVLANQPPLWSASGDLSGTTCEEALQEAAKTYSRSGFQKIIQLLEPCANKTQLKDNSLAKCYELLALSHFYLNEKETTRKYISNWLELNDLEYRPDPIEHSQNFIAIVKEIQAEKKRAIHSDKRKRRIRNWLILGVLTTAGVYAGWNYLDQSPENLAKPPSERPPIPSSVPTSDSSLNPPSN